MRGPRTRSTRESARSRREFLLSMAASPLALRRPPQALDLRSSERLRVLRSADRYLKDAPITITAQRSPRSAGGGHDYFSEGDYWWPDPANPDGLGPSSSSNGCGFFYASGLPSELVDNIFVARFNGAITEASPGTDTLDYRDIVAVDPTIGKIRRIASGFSRPLSLFWDGAHRLLIGDYGDRYL